jgi:hypothetical protein
MLPYTHISISHKYNCQSAKFLSIYSTNISKKQVNLILRTLLVTSAILITFACTIRYNSNNNKSVPEYAFAKQAVVQKDSKNKNREVINLMENDSLKEELKSASLVVKGKVVQTDIEDEKIRRTFSEHDPGFKKAVIKVAEVLKGKLTTTEVEVYYASSDDVRWYTSPKPIKNQEAIFILKTEQLGIDKQEAYTLLDKHAIQPLEDCSKIKGILKVIQ